MNESYISEIAAIWDKLGSLDKKLSDFIDSVHSVSTQGIEENSEGILDVAELSDENNTSIIDLADKVDDLETRVSELEDK